MLQSAKCLNKFGKLNCQLWKKVNFSFFLSTIIFSYFSSYLIALPSGMQLIEGNAAVTPSPKSNTMLIKSQDKTIIHWDQFNIARHESVSFHQPNSQSITLNRVVGKSKSYIHGNLSSNGQLFFINPKGFFLGHGALVKTAGFLASTADLPNDHFLAGKELTFQNLGEGDIVNLGKIKSTKGDILFIARTIRNEGFLEALNGSTVLAQSTEIIMRPNSKERVSIRINEQPIHEGSIENTGDIESLGIEFKTTSIYEKAICHRGTLKAFTTEGKNGHVYLVAKQGGCEINAPLTAKGGAVTISAKDIELAKLTQIDVSSEHGGGFIAIKESDQVHVQPGAKLLANTITSGDGGRISLVAEKAMTFYGYAQACGGKQGGNGGFIEISSKGEEFHIENQMGVVDVRAPLGQVGSVLFDPKFVVISAGGSDRARGHCFHSHPSKTAIIDGKTLESAIDCGNVRIQANTDITINEDVTVRTLRHGLTVQAGRSIIFNEASLTLNQGDFKAVINDQKAKAANRDAGTATFQMNSGSQILSQGGDIIVSVGTFDDTQIGEIILAEATVDAGGGNVCITGAARQDGTDNAYGVQLAGDSCIQTSGTGTLTLTGLGGSGANYNQGIRVLGKDSIIRTESGALTLIGQGGGNGLGNSNTGISLSGSIITTDGALAINGTAGTGTDWNCGVTISNGGKRGVQTKNGNVSIIGQGNGGGAFNFGLHIQSDAQIAVLGSGSLTLNGISGHGTKNNHGVILSGGRLSSLTAPIIIDGLGQGSTGFNYGIRLESGANISSTRTATIDLTGHGVGLFECNIGIFLSGESSYITSERGSINLKGTASGATFLNQGIRLENSQITSTGSGEGAATVTLIGVGGEGTDYCNGIAVQGDQVKISSIDGDIIVIGKGNGSEKGNEGVYNPENQIFSTGSGIVTIESN